MPVLANFVAIAAALLLNPCDLGRLCLAARNRTGLPLAWNCHLPKSQSQGFKTSSNAILVKTSCKPTGLGEEFHNFVLSAHRPQTKMLVAFAPSLLEGLVALSSQLKAPMVCYVAILGHSQSSKQKRSNSNL